MTTNPTTGLRFDAEWHQIVSQAGGQVAKPQFKDVLELRVFNDRAVALSHELAPPAEGVEETKTELPSPDGGPAFSVSRFATAAHRAPPADGEPPRPAVLYFHGGGMVSCSVEIYRRGIAFNAAATGVQFFAVDYPLAPEHPAPAPANACFAALQWLSRHAAEMHVDPARIIVMGDSAGALMATTVALLARDRGLSPPVAKQVLIYPMLDDRTELPADSPLEKFLEWRSLDNRLAWDAYLSGKRGAPDEEIPPYAVPARFESLAGLPTTYIEIGGLDLFRDESLRYALRLSEVDVEVEFHLLPGVPHAFEKGLGSHVVIKALEARLHAVRAV